MAAGEAGDGSTVGVMGAVADGSTAGKRLYLRPALERVARFSARLRKCSGNSNRVSNREKSSPSTLENPDAHLPCRSLSTIRISQKCELSKCRSDTHNPTTCRVAEGLNRCMKAKNLASPTSFQCIQRRANRRRAIAVVARLVNGAAHWQRSNSSEGCVSTR